MPHVTVKMYAGKTDEQKTKLANAITQAFIDSLGYGEAAVSVSVVDVDPKVWADTVYKPEIIDKPAELYKKPGYNPFK